MIEKIIPTIMVLIVTISVGYFILEHEVSTINEVTEFCEDKNGVLNFHGSEVNCTKINEDGMTTIMNKGFSAIKIFGRLFEIIVAIALTAILVYMMTENDNKNKSWGDLK